MDFSKFLNVYEQKCFLDLYKIWNEWSIEQEIKVVWPKLEKYIDLAKYQKCL